MTNSFSIDWNFWGPQIITLLIAIVGWILFFLKYFLDAKKELASKASEKKRECYQKFIDLMIDILITNKDEPEQTEAEKQSKLINTLKDINRGLLLFASPSVINNFSELLRTAEKAKGKKILRNLSKTIASMRKELGLSNRKLGKDSLLILRGVITDFDKAFRNPWFRKFF